MFKKKGILLVLSLSLLPSAVYAEDKPFQVGIEQNVHMQPPPQEIPQYSSYPKFQPMNPVTAPPPPKKPPTKLNPHIDKQQTNPLQGGIQQRPMAPMTVQQPVQGYLPPQFLGVWQVMGSRSGAEAQPQYQAGIDSIFAATTSNTWRIQGNQQQGYVLATDTGVQTALMVETQGNTAILRYQHPIKNTMAQEALVMQLLPGGAQFDGLERISIVKQGEPAPRAKVTYKLIGRRQQ